VGKAILVRFVIAAVLVVPGWIGMTYMMKSGGGTPPPGSRGAQQAEFLTNMALTQAGSVLSDHHATYGTFAGADLSSVPGARLVRADEATFCVEAGEASWLYHLDGTTQQDNSWNWGAVKGACAQ
jgi:hypothetical protein